MNLIELKNYLEIHAADSSNRPTARSYQPLVKLADPITLEDLAEEYFIGYFEGQTALAKQILINFYEENTDPKDAA